MLRFFLFISILSFSLTTIANDISFGKVVKLHGKAKVLINKKWQDLSLNDPIPRHSAVTTKKKSFVSIELIDKTIINLGPKSYFKIDATKPKRPSFNLMVGKMRAIIKKKIGKNEKMKFDTAAVALGVRGTEFLQNIYLVKGKATSDVMLLKGKLAVNASASAPKLKPFEMTAGKSFNTSELARNGMSALKDIPASLLKSLSDPTKFLPNLQAATGALTPLGSLAGNLISGISGGVAAGVVGAAASGLISGSDKDDQKVDQKKNAVVKTDEKKLNKKNNEESMKKSKTEEVIKSASKVIRPATFKYVLKNEPEDIREALQARKRDLKKNKCYFWFYKKIPGSGTKERFKRGRDCDDYDFDL